MKIISVNIRFDNPMDGPNNWAARKPLLAKLINEFSPDILCTQEGKKNQLNSLEDLLFNLKSVSRHRKWILERMYPTFFVNPKTIKIIDSGDLWLSKTPHLDGSKDFDSVFPRLFTWVKCTHLDTNLFLINTHLDHKYSATRTSQCRILVEEAKRINREESPIIVLGDFNESPLGEVRRILLQSFPLYDPWEDLGLIEEGSHHKFQGFLPSAARVDWILCDRKIVCHDVWFDKSHQKPVYPSDHFPLKAVISTPKK